MINFLKLIVLQEFFVSIGFRKKNLLKIPKFFIFLFFVTKIFAKILAKVVMRS